MISAKLLPWAILAAIALAGLSGWQGYRMGYSAAEDDKRAELLAQIEAGQKLDDARRKIAQERDQLARELEERAYADPVVCERCLGPGRVRRLNAIR
ncbi:hypothetical protein [Thiosulfatihalobacter marinus]|uniref:hypothetical protein n=1 Tax=Thiosulfatihalobacter marinus TaxID=2792481 RepID=UPI0018D8214F|nr:hypothetical protein [Thiosulfatihalobacter marinus]